MVELKWKPTEPFSELFEELKPVAETLKTFEKGISLRANDRTGEEFSVRIGLQDCQPGFFICIRRNLLTGRIEGAAYPWYAHLMLFPRRWVAANLCLIERELRATGLISEMPDAWYELYESLPGRGGYAEIFFPLGEREGGNQKDSSPHFSKHARQVVDLEECRSNHSL